MRTTRRWARPEVWILAVGVVVVGVVGALAHHSSSTFARALPRVGATQEIEASLTLSHLWLEEAIEGDGEVDVETDVFGNIDRAGALCQAMMVGGPSRLGPVEAMGGAEDRARLARLCEGIEAIRGRTASRLAAAGTSDAGSPDDQAYDVAFRRLLDLAEADGTAMARQARRDRAAVDRVGTATLVLLGGAVGAMAVLARRRRRAMESRAEEERLRRDREAHLANIVEDSRDAIVSATPGGTILTWNAGAQEMLGYAPAEIVGQPITRLSATADAGPLAGLAGQVGERGSTATFEAVLTRKDGTSVAVAVTASPVRRDGTVVALSTTLHDITAAKALEESLRQRAFYDELTGLPNRSLLHQRLTHGLERAAHSGQAPAVVLVDIDNFKTVNDSLGHGAGDKVLVEVGARFQGAVGAMDTVARLGGDEFVVVVEDPGPGAAVETARRVLEALRAPLRAGGHQVALRASAGVALGRAGHGADEVLGNADAAMYSAKAAGKGHWQLFAPEMHRAVLERLELTAELAGALERDELFVEYQPIVELRSGRVLGAEALVRWRHPARGLVSPLGFISIAEESGQILDLGTFVLRQALGQLHRCLADDPDFYLTVNVSPVQFRRPGFAGLVQAALREAGVDPCRLVLEITETGLMTDVERNIATLAELRDSGVRVAIDDFGTGYSSISYLKRLPVDIVKIDKSLVDGVATQPGMWALLHAILGLIAAVGLETVAEGIEGSAQVAHLEALGCTRGQGYHFSRPVAGPALEALVAGSGTLPTRAPPSAPPPARPCSTPARPA